MSFSPGVPSDERSDDEWGAVSRSNSSPQVSTTVDRAGALLQLLAANPEGLGITVLTRHLNTQRAPLYRILEALIKHRLVRRDEQKRYALGVGTLQLARAFSAQFPAGVDQMLATLADETETTASLISVDGDVLTTIAAKTPNTSAAHVYTPPGFQHPDGPLSMRIALAALNPPSDDDSDEVRQARELGYAVGHGRVVHARYGMSAVVPGLAEGASPVVLALVSLNDIDHERLAEPLLRTAQLIGLSLR